MAEYRLRGYSRLFHRLDLDDNGKITKNEIDRVFAAVDKNGDGEISREELNAILKESGPGEPAKETKPSEPNTDGKPIQSIPPDVKKQEPDPQSKVPAGNPLADATAVTNALAPIDAG